MISRTLLLLLLGPLLPSQSPGLPALAGLPASTPQARYIDFSQDLDRPGVVVVMGKLGKGKDGKRERLEDGQLGAAGAVSQVSGTQYFKVPVTNTITPRTVLFGKPDKLQLQYDLQLARLPDGKERRQTMTGSGAALEDDMLGLFVVAPRPRGKGLELLHVIPFDSKVDKGANGELQFADAMHDFCEVNRRAHDLRAALEAADKATDPAAKKAALTTLKDLLDQKLELRQSTNDGLLSQYVGPLEVRAQKRLADAAEAAAKDAPQKAGDGKD